MIVLNDNSHTAVKLFVANTFFTRLQGLFSPRAESHDGIVIKPCNSIHTIGFSCDIDVFFLTNEGKVVKVVKAMKSNRFAFCFGAKAVIEIFSDRDCQFSVGDVIHV